MSLSKKKNQKKSKKTLNQESKTINMNIWLLAKNYKN